MVWNMFCREDKVVDMFKGETNWNLQTDKIITIKIKGIGKYSCFVSC